MLFFIKLDNFQSNRPLQFELRVLFQPGSVQLSILWSPGKQDVLLTVLQILSLTICLLDSNFGFHSSYFGECANLACCPPCIFSQMKLLLLLLHPFTLSASLYYLLSQFLWPDGTYQSCFNAGSSFVRLSVCAQSFTSPMHGFPVSCVVFRQGDLSIFCIHKLAVCTNTCTWPSSGGFSQRWQEDVLGDPPVLKCQCSQAVGKVSGIH